MSDRSFPVRIQRKRMKGWSKPANTQNVGRPSKWGNSWRVTHDKSNGWCVLDPDWIPEPKRHYCSSQAVAHRFARWKYRRWLNTAMMVQVKHQANDQLKGKNLMCWCPEHLPCHADVLLEIAIA